MAKEIEVKSVLNRKKQRDSWFLDDYTVNLYSSCSFNCLYCYIRGSKYGHNLATSLSVKINAIEILDRQLANRAKKGQYGIILLSSATDPYLQLEQKYKLTRQALQIIAKHRFPVHIITKSDMISRDYDLLKQIDETAFLPEDLQEKPGRGTIISYSFSTLDDAVGKIFEPGATSPSLRLASLQETIQQGFLAGVSMMPLLPFISDTTASLHQLFSTFKEAGVHYIMPATLTLFGNGQADSKTLLLGAIRKHFPELEARYLKYFENGSEMPTYYREAFYRKMKALGAEYGVRDRILT